jgi:WD40 repeat protein
MNSNSTRTSGILDKAKWSVMLAGLLWIVAGAAGALPWPPMPAEARRTLYAINQPADNRGSISVYDINAGHRLIRFIQTVAGVRDVRGVVASAVTGKLYVAYQDVAGTGRIYCLNIYNDTILWNRVVAPGVDRLALSPDGQLLFVPTWEDNSADFINIVDANTGRIVRRVYFSNHSHDTQYPLSGPVFQETKANDGSGRYLYLINPQSYAVSSVGPFSGILGPYAVNGSSTYAVADVTHLWGIQVANLKTGKIITATIPNHPLGDPGLLHGIGWTPDESEVWQSGHDPHAYIWDMHNPMAPTLKRVLSLRNGPPHWLTFTIEGDFAYIAIEKNSNRKTEIFDARTLSSVGEIESSEDMLEIDFASGKVSQVGDQFGIGRKTEAAIVRSD